MRDWVHATACFPFVTDFVTLESSHGGRPSPIPQHATRKTTNPQGVGTRLIYHRESSISAVKFTSREKAPDRPVNKPLIRVLTYSARASPWIMHPFPQPAARRLTRTASATAIVGSVSGVAGTARCIAPGSSSARGLRTRRRRPPGPRSRPGDRPDPAPAHGTVVGCTRRHRPAARHQQTTAPHAPPFARRRFSADAFRIARTELRRTLLDDRPWVRNGGVFPWYTPGHSGASASPSPPEPGFGRAAEAAHRRP